MGDDEPPYDLDTDHTWTDEQRQDCDVDELSDHDLLVHHDQYSEAQALTHKRHFNRVHDELVARFRDHVED